MKKKSAPLVIPADVPHHALDTYVKNYRILTKNTDHAFIFAADQKIEHLDADFHGEHVHPDAGKPEHIFMIAREGIIGALAAHLGLITRYGRLYPKIPYIAKLNGKTNLVTMQEDPVSRLLWTVEETATLISDPGLALCGVGYTIYMGSNHEHTMLAEAAQVVTHAHTMGLLAILWIYPRAAHISDQTDPSLVAGAAGLGLSLGADFVKVHAPQDHEKLAIAVEAAGNTGILCAGGTHTTVEKLLETIYGQLHSGHAAGCAIGRNIFQRSYKDAIALAQAISAIVYDGADVQSACSIMRHIGDTKA